MPKNHFIKAESLSTEAYLDYFFCFNKLDFHKKRTESVWNVGDDKKMAALAVTFRNAPQAMNMSFQREYAE